MPSYTRGQLRDQLVFVLPRTDSLLYYGWVTKDLGAIAGVSTAELKQSLGHRPATELAQIPGVLRASAPKPARVKKTLNRNAGPGQQISVSTFCDADNLKSALSTGWSLAKSGQGISISRSARTESCAVEVDGLLYVYPMNKTDFDAYKTLIGAQENISDADLRRIVRASSNPKPPKMGVDVTTGGVTSSFSCYVSESKVSDLLNAGWQLLADARPTIS